MAYSCDHDRVQEILEKLAKRPILLFAQEARELLGQMTIHQAYAMWVVVQEMATQEFKEPAEAEYWRRLEAEVRAALVDKAYLFQEAYGEPFDFGLDAEVILFRDL